MRAGVDPSGAGALYGCRVALIECLIHQQDIRRPLGLPRTVPPDALRASLTYARVSPLIGGRAVKGPLDRMLTRMAGGTSPAHVSRCYTGLIDALVIDPADAPADADVPLVVTPTLMNDRDDPRRLAERVLEVVA